MAGFGELIKGNKPVLVDFFAEWCGPCKMMAPVLKELASELGDEVRILKVDVDKNPSAAQVYQVRGVPTFLIFKNGKVLWRASGALPKSQLLEALQKAQMS
jgi:thioredoxin 1